MNDKDNIILFPTNRIKDKTTASKPVDDKAHKKLVEHFADKKQVNFKGEIVE